MVDFGVEILLGDGLILGQSAFAKRCIEAGAEQSATEETVFVNDMRITVVLPALRTFVVIARFGALIFAYAAEG